MKKKFFIFSVFICLALAAAVLPARAGVVYSDYSSADFVNSTKFITTKPQDMQLIDEGTVAEIVKPEIIRLKNNKVYTLDNIRVPLQYEGATIDYLKYYVLNHKVQLYQNTTLKEGRVDRFGNKLVHAVFSDNNKWVQGELVGEGFAWAYATITNRDLFVNLRAIENEARVKRKGFWSDIYFSVRNDHTISNDYNSYQIYQGKLESVNARDETIFLNFGKDWDKDFTLRIKKKKGSQFNAKGSNRIINSYNFRNLVGQTIRVRGWVEKNGGPSIELEYPEQMEVLPTIVPD